ncbi:MAG TPA: MotA/TolQ/ExbB proton channel family protein [Myxococcales bacterium LLY-WYZ-16_1]|nr:MotA/TolQ/ExbB proton channel family protein [Myxococcales bacterium LLY-WYZ-16_1]
MALGDLLRLGGWTMVPILASSGVALMVFLGKAWEFRSFRGSDLRWFDRVLERVRSGHRASVPDELEGAAHPAARVIAASLRVHVARPDRVEAEARRVGTLEVQRAEAYLGVLAFIAEAAPLLGLLGTVLGMLDLFRSLQQAGLEQIDLGLLSSGIWQALLTTAAGLAVAVPTLAAHGYLVSRADRLRVQIGDCVQQMLTELSD